MNNEPVAWMSPDGKVSNTEGKLYDIPLYTHPVKELTDEEIFNVAMQDEFWNGTDCPTFNWHDFARAILRKAQEK